MRIVFWLDKVRTDCSCEVERFRDYRARGQTRNSHNLSTIYTLSFYLRRSLRSMTADFFFVCVQCFIPLKFLIFSHLWRLLTDYWKVDFLGKNWLPQEKLTPSGKIYFFGKIWLPREKLPPSGKFDTLGKKWLPRENLTSSGKFDSLG